MKANRTFQRLALSIMNQPEAIVRFVFFSFLFFFFLAPRSIFSIFSFPPPQNPLSLFSNVQDETRSIEEK